jgi:hypothetical protein
MRNSFDLQPLPFSELTLTSCLSGDPLKCCLKTAKDENVRLSINPATGAACFSFDSGALLLVNEEFQLFRTECGMLWFRDRFGVLHLLD